ncbi:MAG: DUF4442 domain-containing protein [Myxococcota bacterium]|nr:DUF4442 domain-containing protein [Myxococcota bacterium]
MSESLSTRAWRLAFNLFPAYAGSGGKIRYIAGDWREVRVEIPLSLRTRNYVGTIYGGSMYGAVDPLYMLMLIKCLGPGYVVWDKAAAIRFRKPGRTTLHARCVITSEELIAIRDLLETQRSSDRVYRLELTDARGEVHAEIEKTIYVRKKQPADG